MISILITALLVAFAGAARASNFTLTAKNHHFCCTNPPFFLAGQPGHAKKLNSMGSSTGSGYQAQVGPNPVTVGTGANPSIKIGMSEAVKLFTVFDWEKGGKTPPPAGFKYIMGTASFVNGAGTLKKGGGNTGFGTAMTISFCPKAKGPGKLACTAPSKATPASFNGRIAVKPGPNKFGGTMQILGGSGLIGGSRNTIWRWIGPSSNYPAAIVKFKLYSSPIGAMTIGKVRVVSGLKTKLVTHTVGSMLAQLAYFTNAMLSNNGAGPFTTGNVTLQVTKNGTPPQRTVMLYGYDKRTPMGAGNVQLVSGEIFNTYNNIKSGTFPIGIRVRLPEPSPSLGLAAGALGLLLLAGVAGGRGRRS